MFTDSLYITIICVLIYSRPLRNGSISFQPHKHSFCWMILQYLCILLSECKQHASTSRTTALRTVFPIKPDTLSQKLHSMCVFQYYLLHHHRVKTIEQKRNSIAMFSHLL